MPWEPFPVIRLTMDTFSVVDAVRFRAILFSLVRFTANKHGVSLDDSADDPSLLFSNLIKKVYKKHGKGVVILIDEYDAAILSCLNKRNQNPALLLYEIEDALAHFYRAMKSEANEGRVRFQYVTGITRPTLGSPLNDLASVDDIYDLPELSTLFGFTVNEIKSEFAPELRAMAKLKGKTEAEIVQILQDRYNGYNWHISGDASALVLNPFVINSVFSTMSFESFWAEEYLPSWLRNFLSHCDYAEIATILGGAVPFRGRVTSVAELLHSPDLDSVRRVLWECGLLAAQFPTTTGRHGQCRLPNNEISSVVISYVLRHIKSPKSKEAMEFRESTKRMVEALRSDDLESFGNEITKIINMVPNVVLGKRSDVRMNESFYQVIIFAVLHSLPLDVSEIQWFTEKTGVSGRVDFMVASSTTLYFVELRCSGDLDGSLKRIKEKVINTPDVEWHDKIKLVAVSFNFKKGDEAVEVEVKEEDYARKE